MLVRVGTPVTQVVEECGGFAADLRKLIMGGPMMGLAQESPENLPLPRNLRHSVPDKEKKLNWMKFIPV